MAGLESSGGFFADVWWLVLAVGQHVWGDLPTTWSVHVGRCGLPHGMAAASARGLQSSLKQLQRFAHIQAEGPRGLSVEEEATIRK